MAWNDIRPRGIDWLWVAVAVGLGVWTALGLPGLPGP